MILRLSALTVPVAAVFVSGTIIAAQSAPQFEVASIRPSPEQVNQVNVGLRMTGSQVRIGSLSLKDYIAMAYDVSPQRITGPEWLPRLRYDVAATIPDGVPQSRTNEMLQRLLADRFKMVVHREQKEMPIYELGVGRDGTRLRPLPPLEQPSAVTVSASGGAGGIGIDLGSGSSFTLATDKLEMRRLTFAQMAAMLTRFMDRPVIDATGLTGSYDVTVPLAPEDYGAIMMRVALNNGVNLPPQALRMLDSAGGNPLAAPFADLGLTFEPRRSMLDIIVVDAMEQTPTEN